MTRASSYVPPRKDSVYDIEWSNHSKAKTITYGDIFHKSEKEHSIYNFEVLQMLSRLIENFSGKEEAVDLLVKSKLCFPAYEQMVDASHAFNLLDSRKAISVTERQQYILRVRSMAQKVAKTYLEAREELGFP